jgi:hypothetical protein
LFLCSALGDVEAIKVTVDLTLTEYRAFIERINAQSMYEVDHLMRESTDFEYTYKHFLACQGKSVSTEVSWCDLVLHMKLLVCAVASFGSDCEPMEP